MIMLKNGNISTYYLSGMTSDSSIYIADYMSDIPDTFRIDYLSNSILLYNKRLSMLINYQVLTRTIVRLYDPYKERAIFAQSSSTTTSTSSSFLIVDSSNIVSSYSDYSLKFLSSFDSRIISLRLLSNNQTIIVQFREMLYVYLQGA